MDGSEKIDLILVFGTGGMLVLSLAIITFVVAYQRRMFAKQNKLSRFEIQLQKELMTAVILEKEKEQKRMAQELHDGIGSALTALKMSLIPVSIEAEEKQRINSMIKSISTDVRRISNELMPSVLEDMGLQKAIDNLTDQLSTSTHISFSYRANEQLASIFREQSELAIYRAVQELLNNIIKYANATEVSLVEHRTDTNYELIVIDDGDGFVPSELELTKAGSLGLKNIKSRIQHVGGEINYRLNSPNGTTVTITLPIDEKD